MMMKPITYLIIVFLLLTSFVAEASSPRKVTPLEEGWKFIRQEVEGAEEISLDDSSWQTVTVPHDWAITGQFDMNLDMQRIQVVEDGETEAKLRTGRTGALPMFGVGWYRLKLDIPSTERGRRVFVEFDGAMSLAKVYLNGEYIGGWPYGYTSFSLEVTDKVKYGIENTLAVRLENLPESSRWYSGAGLYRHVRLVTVNPVHVAHWGTFVTTPVLSKDKAIVDMKTKVICENPKAKIKLVTEIYHPNGQKVGTKTTTLTSPTDTLNFAQQITLSKPILWNTDSPQLYSALSKVYENDRLQDVYQTTFGLRTIRFDNERGFFLNGNPFKIKGVCLHHDLGPVGAETNVSALQRQLRILKEMGCNAIRTSHNPSSPELLDLCDRMGFLVQVEAFDEWKAGKNANGYHLYFDQWAEKDLRAMIRRDRNHPSVIMWSIGNEVREQKMPEGKEVARFLTSICHQEDTTRPVTAGFNYHRDAIANGLADEIDLVGFNYKPHDYVEMHQTHPHYKLYGSETVSTLSTRGVYKFPVEEVKGPWHNDYQTSSYDLECTRWSNTPDAEFAAQEDCPFSMGEFVWTGFDYLGEPTPYNEGTPARSSYFGIVDLAGLKKDRYYLYQSIWSATPVLHLVPHWSWPDRVGENVPIFCYTNYPRVELFVNDVSQGIREKNKDTNERYRLIWQDVIYHPGEIKAVAMDNEGRILEEKTVRTAGAPHKIQLTADRQTVTPNGKDLVYITVEIHDEEGNLCPQDNSLLFFSVEGSGKLKALCNGNPIDQTRFSSNYMNAFNGKMVAVIQAGKQGGEIKIEAIGGKLKGGRVVMECF